MKHGCTDRNYIRIMCSVYAHCGAGVRFTAGALMGFFSLRHRILLPNLLYNGYWGFLPPG